MQQNTVYVSGVREVPAAAHALAEVGVSAPPPLPPSPSIPPSTGIRTAALSLVARRAFGELLPLLDDPQLRDLVVQTTRGQPMLWADRGTGMRPVPGWRPGLRSTEQMAADLIAAGGRHVDEVRPCADVLLGDGIRVHAVLPPVAVGGAAVSIRVPRASPLTFAELVRGGCCDTGVAAWLGTAVTRRRNLLITGATGSGKTTVLAALLDLAAPTERILTIEDVAELRLRHPHVVALQTRQSNAEGIGEVSLDQLLREALRMRPDRIVLGECRGAEVVTLLTALNTGHDGGAGTLHASALRDVPARLEALGALAGLDAVATARQVVSAVHAVVHVERGPNGHRIASIGRPVLDRTGALTIAEAQR